MTQVSDVSRQYAVGSKQSAAAAAQLNVLAAELRVDRASVSSSSTTARRCRCDASIGRREQLGGRPGAGRDLPRGGRGAARVAVRRPAQAREPPGAAAAGRGLFRDAHTVKGSARMLGLDGVVDVAHRAEDLLGALKDGRLAVRKDLVDVLLVAAESINRSLPGPSRPVGRRRAGRRGGRPRPRLAGDDPVAVPARWPPRRSADGRRRPAGRARRLGPGARPAGCTTCSTSSARPSSTSGGSPGTAASSAAAGRRAPARGPGGPRVARRSARRGADHATRCTRLVAARATSWAPRPASCSPAPRTARAGSPTCATAPWGWRWCRCAGWSPASPSWCASCPRRAARRPVKDVALVLDRRGRRARHPGARRRRRRAAAPGHQRRRPRLRVARASASRPASRAQATVTVSARAAGSTVVIEVSDDGRGVDEDALRAVAVARGLLPADSTVSGGRAAAACCSRRASPPATRSPRPPGAASAWTSSAPWSRTSAAPSRCAPSPAPGTTFTHHAAGHPRRAALPGRPDRRRALRRSRCPACVETLGLATADAPRASPACRCSPATAAPMPLVDLGRRLGVPGDRDPRAAVVVQHGGAAELLAWAVDALEGELELVVKELGDLPRPAARRSPARPSTATAAWCCVLDVRELAVRQLAVRHRTRAREPAAPTAVAGAAPGRSTGRGCSSWRTPSACASCSG